MDSSTTLEYLPPEVEAALITAATDWAVFLVAHTSASKKGTTINKQVRDAFVDAYHTLYLNVSAVYPHPAPP